ncbi:MAG: toxin HicA [Candidatus Raymondbacteria bacterium RifOxyA12_full_50_37]|uniref:Toxin HicA n=1 Tax=Candidatus Raymondbacteria bacterium RIFOXYD12_FULL_49_13 TaxID=1817890 RepID=A0A1F7FHF3_UNCRA|nr:MAG: toxin HicA [Candidatus Raymondbacteria bacterium RifOxyA12_full_50_37]OGJ88929.1 MAG: toxin HicA [Candidatus Raymondbacteria bacterium RIFOXYA2_FULL_49_16]OGJ98886.1 MAG: toxin HicA [Candidatus Raymondbacteria bacterium RifOxyB12_full_50_8]OGK05927.1 MAG: toxin HicA [Candidatus Raymondbacteria bacterium RIFOXYD12_FULL_49_13]OGP42091.1 MAG: toxin HicA [Candidatus Raymondbacteria bacterium RIFOXYB2_FULL_49_35]
MGNIEKILQRILQGNADQNVRFSEVCIVLQRLGFHQRTKGSYHIFYKENVEEIINLQPLGNKAKPYQVKPVRNSILKYKLTGEI